VKGSEVSIVIGVVSVEMERRKAAERGREMMLDRDERRDRAIIHTADFSDCESVVRQFQFQ